jgi:hypothetical protein
LAKIGTSVVRSPPAIVTSLSKSPAAAGAGHAGAGHHGRDRNEKPIEIIMACAASRISIGERARADSAGSRRIPRLPTGRSHVQPRPARSVEHVQEVAAPNDRLAGNGRAGGQK